MALHVPEHGGFLPSALSSPVSRFPTSPRINLPRPRSHPLRSGSTKEETARQYIEGRLMHVSRRYTKKFQLAEPGDDVTGYSCIKDICNELGEIVNVLWLSGTPSLQIPYLLNITLSFSTYLAAFPADPEPTFALLRKLDHVFASLLLGQDIEGGYPLPGFQGKRGGMTRTDMVRCKSLVEGMRVLIVEVMSKDGLVHNPDIVNTDANEQTGPDTDMSASYDDSESAEGDERSHDMDMAQVFEMTIMQLGESLGGSGPDVGR